MSIVVVIQQTKYGFAHHTVVFLMQYFLLSISNKTDSLSLHCLSRLRW